MKLKTILHQCKCKHEYKPWANIYGDLIDEFKARTVYLCPKCFKRRFGKEYIDAPLNYNKVLIWAREKQLDNPLAEDLILETVQDKRLLDRYFN